MKFRPPLPAVLMCLVILLVPSFVSAAEPSTETTDVLLHPDAEYWNQQAPERFRIRFTTSEGDFVVEVNRE